MGLLRRRKRPRRSAGVYKIPTTHLDDQGRPMIFIGSSEDVPRRLEQHVASGLLDPALITRRLRRRR